MGAKKPLELQTKHLTKAEIAKKELEESIVFDKDALNNKPEWLVDEIACKEWDRLVNEFSKNSLIWFHINLLACQIPEGCYLRICYNATAVSSATSIISWKDV